MQRSVSLAFCVLTTGVAVHAQDKPAAQLTDPLEILKKVDAACKAVKAVKYRVTAKSTGAAAAQAPEVEGTVILQGWLNGRPAKYRYEAKIKNPGSSEVRGVIVGSDGEEYYLIDHKEKKAYVDIDPEVVGRIGRVIRGSLLMAEFVHPKPFSDEINGDKQELMGTENVGGEECYKVHVVYAGGKAEAIWHFSRKDFLPRARRDIFNLPSGGKGERRKVLADLVVDPKLDGDAFKFRLPDGYTKTGDFAP